MSPPRASRRRRLLSITALVRVWLPVAVVLAGIIAVAVDPTVDGLEGAAHIVGAGLAIWLLNVLVRIGISGERERTEEESARAYFMRHGYWPGEGPDVEPPRPRPEAPRRPAAAPHRAARARVRGPHR